MKTEGGKEAFSDLTFQGFGCSSPFTESFDFCLLRPTCGNFRTCLKVEFAMYVVDTAGKCNVIQQTQARNTEYERDLSSYFMQSKVYLSAGG